MGHLRFKKDAATNVGPSWGHRDYARRSNVLDLSKNYLVRGNLTVEVDIQVMLDKPPTWTPSNSVCSDMLKLLEPEHDDDFDITFQVGEDDTKNFTPTVAF